MLLKAQEKVWFDVMDLCFIVMQNEYNFSDAEAEDQVIMAR